MRKFVEGQTVYVRQRYGDKNDPRYDKKIVRGIMAKNPEYSQYSYRTQKYKPDENGNYVMVSDEPRIISCWKCEGTGKILPEGFDPEASFRQICDECHGAGNRNE